MARADDEYVTFYGVWITVPLGKQVRTPGAAYDRMCEVLAAAGIEWNTDQSEYVTGDDSGEQPGGRTRDLWPKDV